MNIAGRSEARTCTGYVVPVAVVLFVVRVAVRSRTDRQVSQDT